MLKTVAIIFGVIFILIGILGFVPSLTPEGKLLGIFMVNGAHNLVHLLTGVVAILCGLASERASKLFFIIFGVIYGLVTILGFVQGTGMLLGLIAINPADNWLHLAITAVSLWLGLGCCSKCCGNGSR